MCMYDIIRIDQSQNKIHYIVRDVSKDVAVMSWFANYLLEVIQDYFRKCNNGQTEYCEFDTLYEKCYNDIISLLNENPQTYIIPADEMQEIREKIRIAKSSGRIFKMKIKGINVLKSINTNKLRVFVKLFVAQQIKMMYPEIVKHNSKIRKFAKKNPATINFVTREKKENIKIVITPQTRIIEEPIRHDVVVYKTNVKTGLGTGAKILIVILLIIILVILYTKFMNHEPIPLNI